MSDFTEEKITIKSEVYKATVDVSNVLRIDKGNLSDELAEQAGHLGFYATISEILRAKLERAKFDLAVLEANKYKQYRLALEEEDTRRVTEASITAAIVVDADLRKAKLDLIELEKQARQFWALVGAFQQRGNMLMSLARIKALEYGEEGRAFRREQTPGGDK